LALAEAITEERAMTLHKLLRAFASMDAAVCLAATAAAGDLPREGTYHSKSTMSAKHTLNRIGTNGALIVVGEGTGTVVTDWGQGEGPPMKEHCYELTAGKDRKTVVPLMYCVDTDLDGDQLVLKFVAEDLKESASQSNGYSEIVMGSGKYTGMIGMGRIHCDYSGNMSEYKADCSNESRYKFP
jgi:hypothetical protein